MRMLSHFIKQEKGGLAVIFAIILPFIFSCCALVFDGSRVLAKRARMADALNEAALAIATAGSANPDAAEKAKLKILLNDYINAYLPGETLKSSDVLVSFVADPETGANLPVFDIRASVDVKTMLPLDMVPAFSPVLELGNKGKVRKGFQDQGRPADYVFVLDFSGSMDYPSAQSGMTRIELLRKVVNDMTEKALESYPETSFTLVPFETGTSVKYKSQSVPMLNEADGAINGCSTLMIPQKFQHPLIMDLVDPSKHMEIGYDIDFDFWADKFTALKDLTAPTSSSTVLPYTFEQAMRLIDQSRYNYYNIYVLSSLKKTNPAINMDTLVTMGMCKKSSDLDLYSESRVPQVTPLVAYSCEKDQSRWIHFKDDLGKYVNYDKVKSEMERARRWNFHSPYYTILDTSIANLDATVDGMFDEKNIITFPLTYWRTEKYAGIMCQSAATTAGSGTNQLDLVTSNAYLIGPTSDPLEIAKFQTMKPIGGTISSNGLLRAVPEMVKGENPRTVMIVVSDGEDNEYGVLDKLHKDRTDGDRVCDRIRNKLKDHKPVTEDVEIYFISLINDASGRERTKYWADYCTGPDNAIVATNYDDIMAKLIEIMSKYEETGYFYN